MRYRFASGWACPPSVEEGSWRKCDGDSQFDSDIRIIVDTGIDRVRLAVLGGLHEDVEGGVRCCRRGL
jgi:hypothetical protein